MIIQNHNKCLIKTKPGYSCLFVKPMNRLEPRFDIIAGVVDTDSYINTINFPFILNKRDEQFLIKKGEAMVQVIPFKRESWKMWSGFYQEHEHGNTLNKLKKAASTLGHTEVSIQAKDGVLSLSVIENQTATSNAFSIDIDGEFKQDAVFNFIISISNLKILPGDYEVEISSKLITQFKNKELPLRYWIALEKTSTYGA